MTRLNAAAAENRLKGLGLTSVELASANPNYEMLIVVKLVGGHYRSGSWLFRQSLRPHRGLRDEVTAPQDTSPSAEHHVLQRFTPLQPADVRRDVVDPAYERVPGHT